MDWTPSTKENYSVEYRQDGSRYKVKFATRDAAEDFYASCLKHFGSAIMRLLRTGDQIHPGDDHAEDPQSDYGGDSSIGF